MSRETVPVVFCKSAALVAFVMKAPPPRPAKPPAAKFDASDGYPTLEPRTPTKAPRLENPPKLTPWEPPPKIPKLLDAVAAALGPTGPNPPAAVPPAVAPNPQSPAGSMRDRKSTRLNSSHTVIS